jgi:hypothetical protein
MDHEARRRPLSVGQRRERFVAALAGQVPISKAACHGGDGCLGLALGAARINAHEDLRALSVIRIGPRERLVEALVQQAVGCGRGHDPEGPTRRHTGGAIAAQGAQFPEAGKVGEQAQLGKGLLVACLGHAHSLDDPDANRCQ